MMQRPGGTIAENGIRLQPYRMFLIVVGLSLVLALSLFYYDGRILPQLAAHLSAVQSPDGISLNVYQNSSSIAPGGTLLITIIAHNTLDRTNYLPNVVHWATLNMASGPCGLMYPLGIVVRNATGSTVAVWDEFGIYSCPGEIFSASYQLGPLANITKSIDFNGYWTPGITPEPGGYSYGILHPFQPGTYQVVAGDIRGHLAVTYFTVVSS